MTYDPFRALQARAAALEAEALELAERSTITPDEDKHLDSLLNELDEVRSEIEMADARAERLASFRSARPGTPVLNERTVVSPVNVNTRTNPFDLDELRGADPEKRARELRSRAIDVVEHRTDRFDHIADAGREHASRLLEQGDAVARDAAEYVLLTGSEDYRREFGAAMRNPAAVSPRAFLEKVGAELEARTSLTTAGVTGALHAPFWLDSSLVLTNASVVDPMRAVARTVVITGTDQWVAPTTAGATSGLVSENGAFADSTPTFTSTSIQTYLAGSYVAASFQAMEDSNIGNEVAMILADAKARLQAGHYATGTGSSEPLGVAVFASNGTSVVAGTSTGAISTDDPYNLREDLSPRWRDNAVWMASLPIAHALRKLGDQVGHSYSLDLAQGNDQLRLLGKPFYENSSLDGVIQTSTADDVIIHGDFSQFILVERLGMTMQFVPVVQSGGAPYATSQWVAHYRYGSGGLVADAFRMLRVS